MSVETFNAVEETTRWEESMEQKPSVGRVVHYQSYGTPGGEYPSLARAAIVTGLGPNGVHLCVLNPTGMFFNLDVPYDEGGKPGTWRWPPRV